jgi:phenylpyruvate tautomerase PptA (4-oxalocrotonate tautomerase family)
MPVLFIEAPPGSRPEKKRVMMQKITEAIDEAYHTGDTLIFLRAYPVENVAMDGRIQSEILRSWKPSKRLTLGPSSARCLRLREAVLFRRSGFRKS